MQKENKKIGYDKRDAWKTQIHTLVERPEFHVRYIPECCILFCSSRVMCLFVFVAQKEKKEKEKKRKPVKKEKRNKSGCSGSPKTNLETTNQKKTLL